MSATCELITTDRLPERCSYEIASVYLGVSFSTMCGLIRRGELKAQKLAGHPYVRREDLIRFASAESSCETSGVV